MRNHLPALFYSPWKAFEKAKNRILNKYAHKKETDSGESKKNAKQVGGEGEEGGDRGGEEGSGSPRRELTDEQVVADGAVDDGPRALQCYECLGTSEHSSCTGMLCGSSSSASSSSASSTRKVVSGEAFLLTVVASLESNEEDGDGYDIENNVVEIESIGHGDDSSDGNNDDNDDVYHTENEEVISNSENKRDSNVLTSNSASTPADDDGDDDDSEGDDDDDNDNDNNAYDADDGNDGSDVDAAAAESTENLLELIEAEVAVVGGCLSCTASGEHAEVKDHIWMAYLLAYKIMTTESLWYQYICNAYLFTMSVGIQYSSPTLYLAVSFLIFFPHCTGRSLEYVVGLGGWLGIESADLHWIAYIVNLEWIKDIYNVIVWVAKFIIKALKFITNKIRIIFLWTVARLRFIGNATLTYCREKGYAAIAYCREKGYAVIAYCRENGNAALVYGYASLCRAYHLFVHVLGGMYSISKYVLFSMYEYAVQMSTSAYVALTGAIGNHR